MIGADMKSRRVSSEMPTEDIPLLQELAFIKNKQNIQNYKNSLKAQEEQLYKELQVNNYISQLMQHRLLLKLLTTQCLHLGKESSDHVSVLL